MAYASIRSRHGQHHLVFDSARERRAYRDHARFGNGTLRRRRATGGVINIITNKSGNPVAALSATLGSYGYKGADLQLANGNDRAYYNLFVNTADADGYRRNSQQDHQTASGRVGWLLDRGEVFTDFAVYKESMGLPGIRFSAPPIATTRAVRERRATAKSATATACARASVTA